MSGEDPQPKAYRPFIAARYPANGRPENKPVWRVIVHRKHAREWNRVAEMCGDSNARELWEHLTTRPDREPLLGTVTPLKGRHNRATSDGMSRVYHYEITGGGRVDYRYNATYQVGDDGDPHRIVQIISIALGSH